MGSAYAWHVRMRLPFQDGDESRAYSAGSRRTERAGVPSSPPGSGVPAKA